MKKVSAEITFKTKVRKMLNSDGSACEYIDYKRTIDRINCNLRPHQHDYYNSDLFRGMLNHAYRQAIANREWVSLSDLPPSVRVDTSKFLAIVTVRVDV